MGSGEQYKYGPFKPIITKEITKINQLLMTIITSQLLINSNLLNKNK
jgi:hypothetical protein